MYYLIKCLQGSTLLTVNVAWNGISALIESIAAIIFLNEKFNDPLQYLGVIFIISGLFFLKLTIINKNKFIFPKLFFNNIILIYLYYLYYLYYHKNNTYTTAG